MNAKELILGKINSGPETAGMYMYALMMGNDFTRFSNLMVSKEADFFVASSKKNIFNEQTYNRNLDMFGKVSDKGNLSWVYNNYVNLKSMDLNSKKKLISRIDNAHSLYEDKSKEIIPDLELSRILSDYAKGHIHLDLKAILSSSEISNLKFVESFDEQSSEDSWSMVDPYSFEAVNEYEDYDEYESCAFEKEDYMVRFSRAFVELESLKNTLNNISLGKLSNLYKFYKKSKPLKDFGTILSINQGVKSDQAALLSHSNLIGKLIDGMIDPNKTYSFDVLREKFDLKRFLMDEEYRKLAINDFNQIKYDINYLDVLANSPHFFEMLKADIATLDFEEQRSFKFRSIKNIAKSFTDGTYFPKSNDINKFVNSNQINDISKYIDNSMIVKFLIDNNVEVVLPKGASFIKNNDLNGYVKGTLEETTKINLSKPHGRATFIEWFENNVIRDLKKGKTLSFDEELVDDLNLENNSFIDGIKYDYSEDKLTKDMYQYIKPGISMMNIKSENDKIEFENQKLDFIKLGKVYYNGQNVLSLLYLYNLIVNRNKANSNSFTLMFEKSAEFMNPNISLYHQYSRYIADIDMDVNNVLSHNDFIGSNFYLSQEISDSVDPVAYTYRKVPSKQLPNGKFGYEFTLNGQVMSLPKGYVDKYIALTGIRQLSQISLGRVSPTYFPDKETNKQILNILCESIKNKLNIDINIDNNPNNLTKASVNLQDKKVYINAAYASAAEPMHELLHIALELINMKDHNLYTKIVTSVQTHPLYNDISLNYEELQGLDLDEEVFVTVFSNIFNNKIQNEASQKWNSVNDDVHDDLMRFTDEAFSDIFGKKMKDVLHKNLFDLFNESMLEGRFDTLFSESENILNEGLENMQNKMIELGMNKECK